LFDDRDRLVLLLHHLEKATAQERREGGCEDAVAMGLIGEPELACTTSEGAFVAHVYEDKEAFEGSVHQHFQ
jgi:hypothetical protein